MYTRLIPPILSLQGKERPETVILQAMS